MSISQTTLYPWARRFILGARLIALLCIIVGICSFGLTLWKGMNAYQRTLYTPSPEIPAHLAELQRSYTVTFELIKSKVHLGNAVITPVKINLHAPRNTSEFTKLKSMIEAYDANIQTIQNQYVEVFSIPIDSVISTLAAHSSDVKKKLEPQASTKQVAKPQDDTSVVKTITTGQSQYRDPDLPKLYSSTSEHQLEYLNGARSVLSKLLSESTKESSKNNFTVALKNIDMYISVMKSELPQIKIEKSSYKEEIESPPQAQEPLPQLKADEYIQMLRNIKSVVINVVLTDWDVKQSLDATAALVHRESKECSYSESTGREKIIETSMELGKIALITLAMAFLIMVLADFLQAIIDTPDQLRKLVP